MQENIDICRMQPRPGAPSLTGPELGHRFELPFYSKKQWIRLLAALLLLLLVMVMAMRIVR